jgi:hypothetical protein
LASPPLSKFIATALAVMRPRSSLVTAPPAVGVFTASS